LYLNALLLQMKGMINWTAE